MAVTKFGVEPRADGIDLDRVIVDPDYRRRIIDRLRAEACRGLTRSPIAAARWIEVAGRLPAENGPSV
jgi:hypothetical protein